MIRWLCLALTLLAAGCNSATTDPFRRPDTWHIQHDNDANLQVMVADPHDLVRGKGETDSRGVAAAAPVHRLDTGQRTPLIPLNASDVSVTQQPANQPQGNGNGNP